jgi:hypothetical protein
MTRYGYNIIAEDFEYDSWVNEWDRNHPTQVFRESNSPPPGGSGYYIHGNCTIYPPYNNLTHFMGGPSYIVSPGILYRLDAAIYTYSGGINVWFGSNYVGNLTGSGLKNITAAWGATISPLKFEFVGYIGYGHIDNITLREVLPPLPKPKIEGSLTSGSPLLGKGLTT